MLFSPPHLNEVGVPKRFFYGRNQWSIADAIGCSVSTVRRSISRASRKRSKLSPLRRVQLVAPVCPCGPLDNYGPKELLELKYSLDFDFRGILFEAIGQIYRTCPNVYAETLQIFSPGRMRSRVKRYKLALNPAP